MSLPWHVNDQGTTDVGSRGEWLKSPSSKACCVIRVAPEREGG